jgi:hypothetical protein
MNQSLEDIILEECGNLLFDEIQSMIFESSSKPKLTPDQAIKLAEANLKAQVAKNMQLLKDKPENSAYWRAQLDLLNAKKMVLEMQKRLLRVKKK